MTSSGARLVPWTASWDTHPQAGDPAANATILRQRIRFWAILGSAGRVSPGSTDPNANFLVLSGGLPKRSMGVSVLNANAAVICRADRDEVFVHREAVSMRVVGGGQ